jgi:hypothetical protein
MQVMPAYAKARQALQSLPHKNIRLSGHLPVFPCNIFYVYAVINYLY